MTNYISSVIGYVAPVGSRRDEDNRPEVEGYQSQSSTAVNNIGDDYERLFQETAYSSCDNTY